MKHKYCVKIRFSSEYSTQKEITCSRKLPNKPMCGVKSVRGKQLIIFNTCKLENMTEKVAAKDLCQ